MQFPASRKRWVATRFAIALTIVACGGCGDELGSGESRPDRPHIIVYLIDTLRADHLGVYGYSRDTSPFLDTFAKEAVVFERAYTQASWTRASVGSLFSGLFPSRHGAVRREHALSAQVATLPGLLGDAGYTTAGFISNPNLVPVFGFDRGFDFYRDLTAETERPRAPQVHDAVFDYLETSATGPLFLYIHTLDPHDPYEPPPPFDDRFCSDAGPDDRHAEAKALYDGEIAYSDREFGDFVARLRAAEVYDDTLLVVVSDHGEEFGDHGRRYHGQTLFEEQLHVPLLMRFPGGRRAGTRVATPVRVVDLMPTLLSELGLDPPPGIDGQSYRSLYSDEGDEVAGDYEPTHFAEQDLGWHALTSLTRDGFKLIRRRQPPQLRGVQLFDLRSDPGEAVDLTAASGGDAEAGEVAAQMLSRLEAIEAQVEGGTYLEFHNGSRLRATGRLEGRLVAVGGTFASFNPCALEPSDRVALDPTRTQASFAVTLANEVNPTGVPSDVLVDVDRVRFALSPDAARFRVEWSGEAAPAGGPPLALGATHPPAQAVWPFEAHADDEALQVRQRPATRRVRQPFVRVYTRATGTGRSVEIDPALDAQLRALGYVDEP